MHNQVMHAVHASLQIQIYELMSQSLLSARGDKHKIFERICLRGDSIS